jgi:hypothetical protein
MYTTETHICSACTNASLERTRFFPRQLVTAPDMTQDQTYFLQKLRRHNRLLHGWGVVCGARCKRGKENCEVVIEPGYILGPFGDEILIDREATIDVCKQDLDGNVAGPCGQPTDPWCSNVRVNRRAGDKLYVAVRYAECQDRPVRVVSSGCGCDPADCEYSRIRDGYVIRVLPKLPSTYTDPMQPPEVSGAWNCIECGRPCPPCPDEPWVILADITLGAEGSIEFLDCFAHRRYAASLADFYFMCKPLRIRSVRISDLKNTNVVTLKDPKETLTIVSTFQPRVIDVEFENAVLDASTVKKANFKVETMTAHVTTVQSDVSVSKDVARWKAKNNLAVGRYRVTLLGDGSDAIKSDKGSALDGDPTQLPSGDGCPGGNFTFGFEVVEPPIG